MNSTTESLLTDTLKGSKVDAARTFLESCSSTTEALRALMAVMCELDQMREATALEALIPTIATLEAESM